MPRDTLPTADLRPGHKSSPPLAEIEYVKVPCYDVSRFPKLAVMSNLIFAVALIGRADGTFVRVPYGYEHRNRAIAIRHIYVFVARSLFWTWGHSTVPGHVHHLFSGIIPREASCYDVSSCSWEFVIGTCI